MSKRVIIVGGGVIGLCSAYYAAQRGFRVTLLEREAPGYAGCSTGNAGMIVPSHFIPLAAPGMIAFGLKSMWNPESPFYVRPRLSPELLAWGWRFWRASTRLRVESAAPVLRDLHMASRECFEELAEKTGHGFNLVKRGLLMLCKTMHALDEETHVAKRANWLGVPAEVLSAKQTADLDPAVKMDVAGAVYYPNDCHLSPSEFLAALEAELKKMDVEIRRGCAVTEWSVRGGKVSSLKANTVEETADEFVLCGGVWSRTIARQFGLNLPLQAGKGYSVTLDSPRELPNLCSILVEGRVAVTPMNGKLRFGGTMELTGIDTSINERRVRGIVKSALQYFPSFKAEDFSALPAWSGMRPCSPDGLPYLGRTSRLSNLTVACGHAMMGLSLAPISGKIVSELLSGDQPAMCSKLLSPDRFN